MSDATAGNPFDAPHVEEVARLFPAYEILRLIACGGMGAVYHAIQTSLDRPVAIKILPHEFSSDAEFRAGFEAEAKAMAKLNHPNLIGVYDFGEVEGLLYIVMEFVEGKSLFHASHGRAVEQGDSLAMVIGVCHGLSNAHEHGILHRDIKPANILLDAQANPKIGDFGLARALERQIEEGEQIFGTPGYTAPEVLQPPFTIDQRADIFSVGVMLHELLTGQLPGADPRPASQISQCNFRLDAVIQRAIHPDPNRRFSSAMELAQELAIIAAMPIRMLRTSSTHAVLSPTALVRLSTPPATPEYTPATPTPRLARSQPSRPKSLYHPPRTLVKQSSGSGFMIFLVLAVVACVGVYLLMKGNRQQPADPATQPLAPPEVVVGTQPVVPKVEEKESAEDILMRARAAIRRRIGPAIESYKRDMKVNLLGYRKAMEKGLQGVAGESRELVAETLSENLQKWENDGHRLPQTLPTGFKAIDGVDELHAGYVEKQAAIQLRFDKDISSYAGIYVLELQDHIGRIEKDGNTAAVGAVEEEIRSVEADPDRFRSLMLE